MEWGRVEDTGGQKMVNIRKILVPVDFSESSEKAVHYGIAFSRDRSAQICFLHVVDEKIINAVQELSIKGYKGDFVQALRKVIHDRENDLKQFVPADLREGLEVNFLIRRGEPSKEVVSVAKELSIDLIVLGNKGYSASSSTSIGSVTQIVVHDAPCPVLVVRPVERDFIE